MANFKIWVKTLQGTILVFNVDEYEAHEGLITFFDDKTKTTRSFPVSSCEIQGGNA